MGSDLSQLKTPGADLQPCHSVPRQMQQLPRVPLPLACPSPTHPPILPHFCLYRLRVQKPLVARLLPRPIPLSHTPEAASDQFISVQSLSRVQPFATPWTAACQASLSITNSWSLLKLMHQNSYEKKRNSFEHAELSSLGLSLSAHAGPFPLPHWLPLPILSFSNDPSSEKPSLTPPVCPPFPMGWVRSASCCYCFYCSTYTLYCNHLCIKL